MEDEVQRQVTLFTNMNSLPKLELHAHLNGSIRKKTLYEHLSDKEQLELENLYPQMSFLNAMKFFSISTKIVKDLNILKRITFEMLEDWAKQNVIYLEIRTSLKCQENCFTKEDYLTTVLKEIDSFNKKNKMQSRLIISLDRSKPKEDYLDTLQLYKNYSDPELKKLIVGIDYSGNEAAEKHKYTEIIPIFKEFRNLGLKITVHMGEVKDYQIFPFSEFQPDRVSHAYFLAEKDYLEFMKRNIPIEVCPTCSLKITGSMDYSDIPMKNFWKKKVTNINGEEFIYKNICLNTDDTMLILSDISQEYYEVGSAFGMSITDMKEIVLNAIDFIFEKDDNFKEKLRQIVKDYNL